MAIQPDHIVFRYGNNVAACERVLPCEGEKEVDLKKFQDQAKDPFPFDHTKKEQRLYVYTDKKTDEVVRQSGEKIIGRVTEDVRVQKDKTETKLTGDIQNVSQSLHRRIDTDVVPRIDQIYKEKSSESGGRSIAQHFETLEGQIATAKREIVQQINGVLVDEVKRECHSEVVGLRAELDQAKEQIRRLEEQLKSLSLIMNRREDKSEAK